MKVNKHGLKMTGLKKAAGYTENYGAYSGHYVQISYDKNTGEILTDYHYSIGQNAWTAYHDRNIITICYTSNKMTMQQIADIVSDVVNDLDK